MGKVIRIRGKQLLLGLFMAVLAGCGGSSGNPCEGGPFLDDRVVTDFLFLGAEHYTHQASETEESTRYTTLSLGYTTAVAGSSLARSGIQFSLFAKASATSCVYLLPEKITAITITSDADFDHQYPAGLPLNALFHYHFMNPTIDEILAEGPLGLGVGGMSLQFVLFEPPTAALEHQFTFDIELDSGSRFTLVTDTVVFE